MLRSCATVIRPKVWSERIAKCQNNVNCWPNVLSRPMPGFVNKWLLLPPGSFSSDTARIQPSERTKTNIKEDTFMLRYVLRASLAIVLMFAVGTLPAVAQYPGGGGGGMGGGSSPTYTPHGS